MLSRFLTKCDAMVGRSMSSAAFRGYATAVQQKQENQGTFTSNNWENARPYSELPGPSIYEMFRGLLPGAWPLFNQSILVA